MRTIDDGKFTVYDYRDGVFPDRPADKPTNDYDGMINAIKVFKTQMDFLRLFNQTGIVAIVEKWYIDEDAYKPYDYKIAYSMFGTHVTDINSDFYAIDAETGVYEREGAVLWNKCETADIIIIEDSEYTDAEHKEHLKAFYDPTLTKSMITKV